MSRDEIKWILNTNEALAVNKTLLSCPNLFTRKTIHNSLEINMSEVNKDFLQEEIFIWLERRID